MRLFDAWNDQIRAIGGVHWGAHRTIGRLQLRHHGGDDARERYWIHSRRTSLLLLPLPRDRLASMSFIESSLSDLSLAIASESMTPADQIVKVVDLLESRFSSAESRMWSARAFLTFFCGDDTIISINMGAGGAFIGDFEHLAPIHRDVRIPQLIALGLVGTSDVGRFMFNHPPPSGAFFAVGAKSGYEIVKSHFSAEGHLLICDNDALPFSQNDTATSCMQIFASDAGWKHGGSSTALLCRRETVPQIDVPSGWQIDRIVSL